MLNDVLSETRGHHPLIEADFFSEAALAPIRLDDAMQTSDIWFPTVFFFNLRGMSLLPSVTHPRARFMTFKASFQRDGMHKTCIVYRNLWISS